MTFKLDHFPCPDVIQRPLHRQIFSMDFWTAPPPPHHIPEA